jgi:hypothetical protein
MLIGSLKLQVDLLMGLRGLSVNYVIVERDTLVFIYAANVPLIGSSVADLGVAHICVLLFKASDLSDGAIDLDLLGAQMLYLS